ncbi:MAG: hypothetical protein HJJLKODD_02442 [Phycisphaerae bacterium]|nr:hypothetical protein [Phycisphaerae bacterium]
MVMDHEWQQRYAKKVQTASEAVQRVHYGHRVFIGSGAAEPQELVRALAARADLSDTEIVHILTLGVAPYADAKLDQKFRHNAFFIGANVREAVAQGRADYTPIFLSEIPRLFRSGRVVIDVALIQVSPPDRFGYCSYGVSTDIVKSAAESARLVVAEVNQQAPRALGECFVHVDQLDVLVPCDYPLLEAPQGTPDELSRRIAKHIADLIEDGATLQMGIGTIPDAVLHFLHERRDLGIHTEMFSDGVIDLVEKGVINNARKTLHPGKIVASFVMGSRRLYDFVDNNPLIEFHPSEYTNDPFNIARNDKMVAINSALEVDITGQVCADSLGLMFYSGIGGQVDFVRGAARSRGGKPIIALPSTTADESISRIVPILKPGAGVVTSRGDVHYVVTEFGAAYLHGKSIRDRALALIQIAHPKFRPWLLAEARMRRMIGNDYIDLQISTPTYPEELEKWIDLRDGLRGYLRPLKMTDEPALRELIYDLSDETIRQRFFDSLHLPSREQLKELLRVDYQGRMAVVMKAGRTDEDAIMGVASYANDPATNLAQISLLVVDAWQKRGVGWAMFMQLLEYACKKGLSGLTADVLVDNQAMMRLFHKAPLTISSRREGAVYKYTMLIHPEL